MNPPQPNVYYATPPGTPSGSRWIYGIDSNGVVRWIRVDNYGSTRPGYVLGGTDPNDIPRSFWKRLDTGESYDDEQRRLNPPAQLSLSQVGSGGGNSIAGTGNGGLSGNGSAEVVSALLSSQRDSANYTTAMSALTAPAVAITDTATLIPAMVAFFGAFAAVLSSRFAGARMSILSALLGADGVAAVVSAFKSYAEIVKTGATDSDIGDATLAAFRSFHDKLQTAITNALLEGAIEGNALGLGDVLVLMMQQNAVQQVTAAITANESDLDAPADFSEVLAATKAVAAAFGSYLQSTATLTLVARLASK